MQLAILLCGVGTGVTQARLLGPAGRGQLATALLWPGILVIFGDLGLGFAFSYYGGKERDKLSQLWSLAALCGLLIGCAIALVGWVSFPLFVPGLRGAGRPAFAIALMGVPAVLVSGYQAYILLGTGHVADYNAVKGIASGVNLAGIGLLAALRSINVVSCVSAYVIAQFIAVLLSAWLLRRRFAVAFRIGQYPVRKLFAYGAKAFLASLAAQTNLRADQAVMSIILSTTQLGQYVVAVSISGILGPFLTASAITILPRTTNAGDESKGALETVRHVKISCLLSSPIIITAILLMPYAIGLLFGRPFLPGARSAQILVVAGLFQGLNGVLGNSLRGMGRPGLPAVAEALGALITAALLFALLPPLGILGAAIASAAAYFVVTGIQLIFVARASQLSPSELFSVPMGYRALDHPKQFLRGMLCRSPGLS